jgi:hypothetical protein
MKRLLFEMNVSGLTATYRLQAVFQARVLAVMSSWDNVASIQPFIPYVEIYQDAGSASARCPATQVLAGAAPQVTHAIGLTPFDNSSIWQECPIAGALPLIDWRPQNSLTVKLGCVGGDASTVLQSASVLIEIEED